MSRNITKHQLFERVDYCENLIVELLSSGEIVKRMMDEFKISRRQAQKYISRVYKRWEDESNGIRAYKRGEMEEALNLVIRECRAVQEFSTAVIALNLKAKLYGLGNRVEVTGKDGGAVEIDYKQDLAEAIEKLTKASNG